MNIVTNTATITELTGSSRRLPVLLHLLQFGDSALPVGGFSFSNGLESAIQQNIVHDADSLRSSC
jgi:urease accessory protein